MDIDLLSKMVKELILDRDEVTLPGVGTFVAETVPASFSDRGYTINPPYRRLSFRQRQNAEDNCLIELYARSNGIDQQQASRFLLDFLMEMKEVLKQKKSIVFPGLGRLRSTKENNFFFVADEDLDIYPEGFGLEPISLKTHQETPEEVTDAIQKLKAVVMAPAESASPAEEEGVVVGSVSFPTTAPSDERETEAPIEPEAVEPEPVLEEVVPIELVEPEETTAPSDVREPKVRKKLPTWAKALIWIVASVLAFLLLFAIGARLFPDFFDSILYSHEELDIIRF